MTEQLALNGRVLSSPAPAVACGLGHAEPGQAPMQQAFLGSCPIVVGSHPLALRITSLTVFAPQPPCSLQDIQSRGALQDPRCAPLIGLMDQLGLTR